MNAGIQSPGEIINRKDFFLKGHGGLFKRALDFDIYDPETNQLIMECREERPGFLRRLFRFNIQVRTPEVAQVVRVERGFTPFVSRFRIYDHNDQLVGGLKEKFLSPPDVLDRDEQPVCTQKRNWAGWGAVDFRFVWGEHELAQLSRKLAGLDELSTSGDYSEEWAGLVKLFTSDDYMLSISPSVPPSSALRRLILGAVMCIIFLMRRRSGGG
jgi:hypothetical protein